MSGCGDHIRKKETFEMQLGTYILDVTRSKLGVDYKDSLIYKNITVMFKMDSTFIMNMKVPIFNDSIGSWTAGNGLPDDYNQLFFKNKNYKNNQGEQFFPPYLQGKDSVFLLLLTLVIKNEFQVKEIYFKKISSFPR